MNGATALVSMLSGYGVDVIFGVPGDTNVALYEALRTVKGAPRHILCRDERSAVFMADCYARLSGKPGVAEVPSGAGALYGLPGVAEANKSSVPLILLVNDIPQPGVGRGTLTELPIEELFKPLCKRAETLGHVGKLPEVVRRAFREATGGRPGAVVLALPEDLLYQDMLGEAVSLHVELQCREARAILAVLQAGDWKHVRGRVDPELLPPVRDDQQVLLILGVRRSPHLHAEPPLGRAGIEAIGALREPGLPHELIGPRRVVRVPSGAAVRGCAPDRLRREHGVRDDAVAIIERVVQGLSVHRVGQGAAH